MIEVAKIEKLQLPGRLPEWLSVLHFQRERERERERGERERVCVCVCIYIYMGGLHISACLCVRGKVELHVSSQATLLLKSAYHPLHVLRL